MMQVCHVSKGATVPRAKLMQLVGTANLFLRHRPHKPLHLPLAVALAMALAVPLAVVPVLSLFPLLLLLLLLVHQ